MRKLLSVLALSALFIAFTACKKAEPAPAAAPAPEVNAPAPDANAPATEPAPPITEKK